MNRYAITLGAATALVGALVAGTAGASGIFGPATVTRSTYTQASGACQGSLPSFEGNFRKRPLGVANEGTTDAFLTCGVRNDENSSPNAVRLIVANRRPADVDVTCTLVDGIFDSTIGFASYYPQTVTVTAGAAGAFDWNGVDLGLSAWQAISCGVPAQVEANIVYTSINDAVGN